MSEGSLENVVIIVSGPAGWCAATYAARAQLKPLVFEGVVHEAGDFLWKERYEVAGLHTIYNIMAVRIESFLYALL